MKFSVKKVHVETLRISKVKRFSLDPSVRVLSRAVCLSLLDFIQREDGCRRDVRRRLALTPRYAVVYEKGPAVR